MLSNLARERLYTDTKLGRGSHEAGDGACLMEMTSLLAGEKHGARPACACPVITAFAVRLNDGMPDDLRQMLKPYAPAFIGTRDGHEKERCVYLAMRAVTVFAPFWLRLTGKPELIAHARACEAATTLPEARHRIAKARVAAPAAAVVAAVVACTANAADGYYVAHNDYHSGHAAYAAMNTRYHVKHLPSLMPAILETLDGLLLIGADKREVRAKGVVLAAKETV